VALSFIFLIIGQGVVHIRSSSFTLLRLGWLSEEDALARELRKTVVRLETKCVNGYAQMQGTGFNVDQSGIIITNRHLLENAASVLIAFPGGSSYEITDWHISTDVDLAVIELNSSGLPVAELASSVVVPGDEVIVIGHPLHLYWVIANGEVLRYRMNYGRRMPLLMIDVQVYPGSSGSPVFNKEGKVVGVIFATLYGYDGKDIKGLALERSEVIELLQSIYAPD